MVSFDDGVKQRLDAHRQDQDADNPDHGDQPEHPVVGVVGAGELAASPTEGNDEGQVEK
ncbi:hypothetical protein NG696_01965 [Pseudarthrobacter sp. HLT1-5]|nr:hypothetical protein [Pseudarthrobacter sp. HLT1-5]